MVLPNEGMSPEAIFSHLDELKHDDVRWREGRAFSLVYYGGADVLAVAEEAYRRYSTENALNTDAFPGLRTLQADVVGFVGEWLDAGDEGAGFMTSGGTESILMAVKAARERGREELGITVPNVVLPTSAHAAFEKGCYYFGLESRRVAVESRLACRRAGDGGRDRRQHRVARRVGAAISARGHRSRSPRSPRSRRPATSTAMSMRAWAASL